MLCLSKPEAFFVRARTRIHCNRDGRIRWPIPQWCAWPRDQRRCIPSPCGLHAGGYLREFRRHHETWFQRIGSRHHQVLKIGLSEFGLLPSVSPASLIGPPSTCAHLPVVAETDRKIVVSPPTQATMTNKLPTHIYLYSFRFYRKHETTRMPRLALPTAEAK